jgi:hypothetical protein
MAERLDDQVARVNVLAKIGEVYGTKEAGLADAAKAKKVLAEAADLAAGDAISDRFRPQALAAVALGYANANLAGDANIVTEKLESLVRTQMIGRPLRVQQGLTPEVRIEQLEKPGEITGWVSGFPRNRSGR